MKKSDKWVVIRVSVEEMDYITRALKASYDSAFLQGFTKTAGFLLNLYFKLTKNMEIEDD